MSYNINNNKAVIFDFDGTIVDSMHAFADIASKVMPRHYDIDGKRARELYLETSGIPFFQQLEQIFPGNPANETAAKEFEATKLEDYFEKPLYDDVHTTLDYLREAGIKTVVSSNNFQELVDRFVENAGIHFDMVLGYMGGFAKGEEHFAHIEKEWDIARDDMIFVGDSIKDGERAESSGVSFIGKTGIFTREQFAERFPGVRVIEKLEELKSLL